MNYKIIGKYIKEVDFRIPNPKTFFLISKEIGNYKINIDIKSIQVKKNIIEVLISLNLKSKKEELNKIITKIVFATILELSNDKLEKEEIENIVLVDVPSKVYLEIRKIFINLFENSGFKDIKIGENVDFQKLHDLKKVQ